jgi:hypothetical protein
MTMGVLPPGAQVVYESMLQYDEFTAARYRMYILDPAQFKTIFASQPTEEDEDEASGGEKLSREERLKIKRELDFERLQNSAKALRGTKPKLTTICSHAGFSPLRYRRLTKAQAEELRELSDTVKKEVNPFRTTKGKEWNAKRIIEVATQHAAQGWPLNYTRIMDEVGLSPSYLNTKDKAALKEQVHQIFWDASQVRRAS